MSLVVDTVMHYVEQMLLTLLGLCVCQFGYNIFALQVTRGPMSDKKASVLQVSEKMATFLK